ncbi:AfsA-related hotdog domain-containing protein [Actinokineospora inagensis]|uniref:AfsA-related hotdog domain-containing protein n=1 Tax=Actinokineospora inagensis TaxID=103730 RepID=UPI000412A0C7|nr:AfsA-related hotdog domain-containing protein [Actinokineospora inagensis]
MTAEITNLSTVDTLVATPVVVVGDRFAEFLANRDTVSVSTYLAGGEYADRPVVVGQGLSDDELTRLAAHAVAAVGVEVPRRVEKSLTHKREDRNVMIGPPRQVDAVTFTADLLVDQANETLEDHLTGQHIPAVALIEAARQTWTAVSERFLLDGSVKTRFVVGSVRSRFLRFVFPLPAIVRQRVVERTRTPVDEVFEVLLTVEQGGLVAAEIEAQYRVVPETFSAKQEALAARQAVRDHVRPA